MTESRPGAFSRWLSTRRLFADPAHSTPRGWVLCAVATAVLSAVMWLCVGSGDGWHRLAVVLFALAVPLLIWVDLVERRLPDVVVIPLALVVFAASCVAAVMDSTGDRMIQACLGAVLLSAVFFAMFVFAPASLGFGDVKLAVAIGLLVGWYGWRVVVLTLVLTLVIGVVHGLVVAVAKRRFKNVHIAFGPSMLVAALLVCVLAGASM
ncbi:MULTISPECIES: prepilin peptidase [unclassified Brevibacterium]|uniref:prepilin peptidase n=1 Tax=unclassified Brevibacterium TaxID=2614124 RepID=UPI0008A4FFD5|nr:MULTISPECIES: A24 family peptidase [unclassified Brevibacterium]OFL68793.1 hypothetical protein HMPREF2757_07770 [Brevibacterium sp. HMSC063G07]OFS25558.1 hypothetical protein HMPREF3162_08250 [Brevibacterium sp. HMSC07C04]